MCVNGWRDILILLSSSRKSSDDVPLRIRGKDDAVIRGILTEEVRQMRMFHELTFQTKKLQRKVLRLEEMILVHVAAVKNINNVVENNLFYKGLRDFEKAKNT